MDRLHFLQDKKAEQKLGDVELAMSREQFPRLHDQAKREEYPQFFPGNHQKPPYRSAVANFLMANEGFLNKNLLSLLENRQGHKVGSTTLELPMDAPILGHITPDLNDGLRTTLFQVNIQYDPSGYLAHVNLRIDEHGRRCLRGIWSYACSNPDFTFLDGESATEKIRGILGERVQDANACVEWLADQVSKNWPIVTYDSLDSSSVLRNLESIAPGGGVERNIGKSRTAAPEGEKKIRAQEGNFDRYFRAESAILKERIFDICSDISQSEPGEAVGTFTFPKKGLLSNCVVKYKTDDNSLAEIKISLAQLPSGFKEDSNFQKDLTTFFEQIKQEACSTYGLHDLRITWLC